MLAVDETEMPLAEGDWETKPTRDGYWWPAVRMASCISG